MNLSIADVSGAIDLAFDPLFWACHPKYVNLTSSMKPACLLFARNIAGVAKTEPGPDANLC